MQGNHLFEYAVIRVMPRVEREEFLNVGVVLFCKQQRFLQMRYVLNETRLHALCDQLDVQELEGYLKAFEKICNGEKDGGPIAKMDVPSRFRWLTAMRSTVVQTSRVHPGLSDNPEQSLQKLFEQLVL